VTTTGPGRALRIASILAVTAGVFVACGGTDPTGSPASSTTTTTAPTEDIEMTSADFPNIQSMTKVDSYFVANQLGHLEEALAVARSPKGGEFPVGTLIQLVPQEAMVKRRTGWNPATQDWEFFFLDVTPEGTRIVNRGADQVVNRFGGNCASCHLAADPKWDMICKDDHGCEPLPIGDDVIAAIQLADPRPR
jgi:mono/diheme cytochrome c family protein